MKLSGKQLEAFTESTARLNFWQGSVRSGKTYSSLVRLLEAIRHGVRGDIMICGVSREAIQRNIISELCRMIGAPEPSSKVNEIRMLNRKIHLIGASDERAVAKIQGSTLAYSYCDELTRLPEPFFRMLLSRLSVKGAQLFASMNPDSPMHWCKRDFLDRESDLDLRTWKFTLDDNPSLDKKYIEDLKAEYFGQSAYYQRYILGNWCVAQGLVFEGFDDLNLYEDEYPSPDYFICGIDYGTVNPTAAVLIGVSPKRWPQLHIEKEYFWDSRKQERQKTDYELAQDIKDFIGYRNISAVYIDPAAASFKLELSRADLPVMDANNDVLPGIRNTHKFIAHKNIVIHKSCKNLIEELQTYSWCDKAALKGIDRPKKENDHMCFIAGTMIATSKGDKPIEQVEMGDLCLTPNGYFPVITTMSREVDELWELKTPYGTLVGTKDHPIWCNGKMVPLKDFSGYHEICVIEKVNTCPNKLSSTELSTEDIQNPKTNRTEITLEPMYIELKKEKDISIETYGNFIMEKSQMDITSITSTETNPITQLKTSNACLQRNTLINIQCGGEKAKIYKNIWKQSDLSQKNGTQAKKEESGIETTDTKDGRIENLNLTTANSAEKNTKQKILEDIDFVPINANLNGAGMQGWTMKSVRALCVVKRLSQTDIQILKTAQDHVQQKKEQGKDSIKVYNLEVEKEHKYFANQLLASNCDALRYAIATNFIDGSLDCANEEVTLAQRKRMAFGIDSNPSASWQPFGLQGRF